MKRIYLAALLLLCLSTLYAQNNTVSIHDSWIHYATDTTLTYQQITHICDSLFAMVGYTDTATVSDTPVVPKCQLELSIKFIPPNAFTVQKLND